MNTFHLHCNTLTKIANLKDVVMVSTHNGGRTETVLTGEEAMQEVVGWLYRKYVNGASIRCWFRNDPILGRVLYKVKDTGNGYTDEFLY